MNETTQLPTRIEQAGIIYEDRNQQVNRVVAQFNGFEKEYLVSDSGERAGVLVIRDGAVLLVRQYRLLIDGISLEIPGGAVDAGESPAESAKRECEEETGVICRDLAPLIEYFPGLDTTKNRTYVFASTESIDGPAKEPDSLVWISFEECLDMIFRNDILDALTTTAVLGFHAKSINGR